MDADILANFVGTKLLTDENAIRYVVGYKRSFGVWMREQITRLKAAFGSKNAKVHAFLDKAARLYHDALVESKNTGRDPEKNKYSISRTRRMNWREQVEGYFRQNGSIKSSDSLYLGTSESTLSEKGIPDAPLYVPTSIINKATRKPKGSKSGHSLTQNDILSLAEGIKNAPIIIHNPARNALIYVTSNKNASGQNIVAIFDLNNDLHGENAHRATSIHGRDSVAAMLKNLGSDSTVFITNENGFNDIAGLQSNITSELLAKVESIENSISEVGENVNSSSKKSFSVSEIQGENEDYGQGVILDTELFKGISPRNWGKTLRDYFYKNLAGKEFTAYDEDGRSEVIHLARKNDRVQKDGAANNHRVADKLARYSGDNIRSLTTVHIPEAIEVSRYKSSSDDHSHQWLDSDGWEYRTVYLQDRDGKIYEAELNIAHGNDRLILYDITNIKQIDKKRKAPEGVVGSSGRINTAGDLAHYPDASDRIIADKSENVNSSLKKSFSVSEADEFDESIMDTDVNAETLRELKQEAERKASSEYDKLLQEEYNKRQVLYNPDEGKSVKREDLKKVDKEYLERTERQLMNRFAQRMD